MYLTQQNLQHINSITHEGKVLVFATDATGKISYTVKQDGFEDSYLNTPPDQRTGWESWKSLEFPNETDDKSVIDQETAKLTHQEDTSNFILRSRYKTDDKTAVAPVQAISALGHVYIFRQSKSNTLLVDRFVLDGMTNKLNRKLEVRFKRSKQKHTPTKNMNKGSNGLVNIDSLDFRDANGNFFYEPTTELCLINNLHKGWFSIVLVPTVENDVHRWHIFAYNSQTQKVELTTIRTSEEGLFEVKDYTVFEEINETLVPRQIAGIIKRTLDISGTTITNGLTATKYDLQQEQQTQSGEMQLLKTATRLMLAIPTDKGTATLNFAIAGDGTLAEIDETPHKTIIRSKTREILLPLNTLDEIKALADRTPPPQGMITGLAEGTDEDDAENLVKIATQGKASELTNGDLVKIMGTSDYQGLYRAKTVDENTFDLDLGLTQGLGYWEKQDEEEGGLIFDGMITAYEKTADGKLRVTCPNHGLENGDEVQIAGTENYNDSYPVKKLDDTHFVIERQWAIGSAINIKLVSRKRRGIVFDGTDHHVALPEMNHNYSKGITVEAWVWYDSFNSWSRIIDFGSGSGVENIVFANEGTTNNLGFHVFQGTTSQSITAPGVLETGKWMHLAASIDESGIATLYKNGEVITTGSVHLPKTINRTKNYIARSNWYGDQYFQGKISDVRIWKTSRTAEDIKNSMYLQLTGNEVGLVGYWRLGAIAEGKVVDFSINCNDGIVHGDVYVSAATLNRQLAGRTDAVKYSNPELFAVSERATYEETFEFKVNSATTIDLDYLDNADGKNLGTKIFTLSYWGKSSRSAEDKKIIAAEQIKQDEFEDLGKGWYRACCNVTIPDGVSLLRSFEIDHVKGNWLSLEIRKHRIRLLSDSITEAKYTDGVTLATLVDDHATLAAKLKELELKEIREAYLLKEKRRLEQDIANLSLQGAQKEAAITAKNNEISQQKKTISDINQQISLCQNTYQTEQNNPLNYWCKLVCRVNESWIARVYTQSNGLLYADVGANGNPYYSNNYFKFVATDSGYYRIVSMMDDLALYGGSKAQVYSGYGTGWQYEWTPEKLSWGDYYLIRQRSNGEVLNRGGGDYGVCTWPQANVTWEQWKIVVIGGESNNNISNAYSALLEKQTELRTAQERLRNLENELNLLKLDGSNQDAKKAELQKRLDTVKAELTTIQTEINTLNTDFLNAVKNTQAKPQTMPEVAKDSKGLVTQGALLGFVQSASRLNAIETCEGNVQLSYLDREGRMRQTNYDATADGKNAAFEQWIPDAQRACLNFSNSNSVVKLNQALYLTPDWSIEAWFVYPLPEAAEWNTLVRGKDADHHILVRNRKQLGIYLTNDSLGQNFYDSGFNMELLTEGWHHLTAVGRGDTTLFYVDGKKVGDVKAKALKDAEENLNKNPNDAAAKKKVEDLKKASLKSNSHVYAIGNYQGGGQPFGKVAEVRVWKVALSDDEIAVNSTLLLSGNEPGLLAYYPMSEATGVEVRDHSGNGYNATVSGANWWGCTAPIGKVDNPSSVDALVSAEYSTVTVESSTKTKVAIMRRFFAYPATNGVTLLPDKRIETLELKWIGNAQFAPTLLGYIEGPPPVPSENLTLSDDYNGATSVELTMSEDVAFSWNRSQDSGLGANAEIFAGGDTEMNAGLGLTTKIGAMRAGVKGNLDFNYQFQNESSITSSSSLSMSDKLELRGTPEERAKFPHLGTRFIPKNIGYALVVSAIADVFVTRLARSGKMVGYQVQPVDGIPPDVNTITFLMNPAYTMNGSLDGLTGSSATTDRFFKHVPEMRSQYGSLYPASYYRLQEAYDLKRQIEAEDKRRESYFSNFDVRLVDETSLDRNIDSGPASSTIGVQREEDKPSTDMTEEEKKKAEAEKLKNAKADAEAIVNEKSSATKAKQAEIQSKIDDQEKRVQATNSFAGWQKRMEDLQIRAGKRNIVNTYVWDADGGLRTEAQSFANTVEHTIGGSFSLNAGLGVEGKFAAAAAVELTVQATVNLTQTMSKTEARSKGFELNVDLGGLEYKGITDYNDNPILPGEKVDRYRFMSFYLEGSTNHFQDFFNYVVDPEWLASNDEEARALRQAQAGKPNKAWRVLHRVTYVERPALMGFGRDVRKLKAAATTSENQQLLDKIAKLEKDNRKLEAKLDQILQYLQQSK
ncbi:LamG domain-containing protein [Planktothrix agardhii]|uniref:LamG domain-containing protein n=1 Tax=Planktothrix agardhii TaxID=1160 RepID=UPI0004222D67|nr:LamG domain-containing protein [Planktothrix agardhii]